jgi:alkylated DNA repair dioxygenase AlkB
MDSLFPSEPSFPAGFSYHDNFLNEAEEQELIRYVEALELHTFQFRGYEAKRNVASFGYDYSFEKNALKKGKEIPGFFSPLISKVQQKLSDTTLSFAELLVTQYPPGSVINWHRDAFPFELIAGISLASDCIFRLRPHDKLKQNRRSLLSFPVKRRSLYIMEKDVRHNWQHSIAPVGNVRYSITLRTLKQPELHQPVAANV